MTAETDEILHTIKRMVRQSLHDMEMDRKQHEMDKQRYENERMERQAHLDTQAKELRASVAKMQAQLDAEAKERKARIAKMQAEQAKIIKETKLYPWVALLIVILAICGTIFKLLQS